MKIRSIIGAATVVLALTQTVSAQPFSPDHKVSLDKGDINAFLGDINNKGERKSYKGDELYTIGMPCGGIAAGQLYVRGDGSLANWWIANNGYNTGYGIDWLLNFDTPHGPWKVCYQTFEPFSYVDQGFSVTVNDGAKSVTKELSKKGFDDISFIGEYPVAYIDFNSKSDKLPIDITQTTYSPFIPLNAKESATPATIIKYTVKNTSPKDVKVTLNGWLQNLVMIDYKDRSYGTLRNKVVEGNGMQGVYMDIVPGTEPAQKAVSTRRAVMFDDFESGTFKNWKSEGEAFSSKPTGGPVMGQDPFSNGNYGFYLANSYTGMDKPTGKLTSKTFSIKDKFITFMIAGGSHKDKTCINLVVDGKVARTAVGPSSENFQHINWDVTQLKGKTAYFEIVDEIDYDWGHISVDNIEFANEPIAQPKLLFEDTHAYFGNVSLSVIGGSAVADVTKAGSLTAEAALGQKLNGGVSSEITLKAGETRDITFLLTWFFPNRPLSYKGSEWNKPLPPNTPAIGNMYANWYSSSTDVANHLKNNYNRLEKETFNFHDTYYNNSTIPYWLARRLMMPISILATETCQWWATDKFWAWEGVGSCEGTCTHVWGYEQAMGALFPELNRNLREKTDYSVSLREDGAILSRNGEHGVLIDGHASVILRMYREHLMSKDGFLLSRNWDKIKRSLDYIITEDGNEDGLIVKNQPNTYDISFNGANTYVGGLYLAALRAGEKMAEIMKDPKAGERYKKIYEAGSKNTMDRLWNGKYFIQDVDHKEYPQFQYGDGCLSDQLFGQTWADLYGLGDLYPQDAISTTLESIWKYNWTNDVKAQSEAHLPERYYAKNGEPGLFICTWPYSTHPGENGVRYRDEVWTGIEYQVATNMISRGKIDKGLAIVKAIDSRYDGTKHNPWNEIECGDHYARAMASYGVLIAIEDYKYDGPKGIMGFSPKLSPNNFEGFFTAAEGWGNLSQKITGNVTEKGIAVKYGRVMLQKVVLDKDATKVSVTLDGKEIPSKVNGREVSFDKLYVNKGQQLKLVVL